MKSCSNESFVNFDWLRDSGGGWWAGKKGGVGRVGIAISLPLLAYTTLGSPDSRFNHIIIFYIFLLVYFYKFDKIF